MAKIITILAFLFPLICFGQTNSVRLDKDNPSTILWKISGNNLKSNSYLLGTHHMVELDWTLSIPEIQKAVDSSRFFLNEAFSSDTANTVRKPVGLKLKATSVMTPQQYKTLDSFFVARVGEGVTNNKEAENMTVGEMANAIMIALTVDSDGQNAMSSFMDLGLFNYFQKQNKKGDRLDRVATTEFDSSSIGDAKRFFSRQMDYIKGSNSPDWNIYGVKNLGGIVTKYKDMRMPYLFDEDSDDGDLINEFDYVTLKVRNRNWIPKIEDNIQKQSCLIAVGFGHLMYKSGVIILLREKGYTVEPVELMRPK